VIEANMNRQTKQFSKDNSILNLPKISSFLFPEEYELLPNATELFEKGGHFIKMRIDFIH
jgi:hypothetical protein